MRLGFSGGFGGHDYVYRIVSRGLHRGSYKGSTFRGYREELVCLSETAPFFAILVC